MAEKEKRKVEIQKPEYLPIEPHRLDLEILYFSDLRQRVGKEKLDTIHQYSFHVLVCITHGKCTHMVDFKRIDCKPGSLLALQPGQVHTFGFEEDWDGWILFFRPEFLQLSPAVAFDLLVGLDRPPEHLHLTDTELCWVTDTIAQMQADAGIDAQPKYVLALLRHQLCALLWRLSLVHDRQKLWAEAGTQASRRFRRFQQLVEKKFDKWHLVADYARQLGCSEKSLTRATKEAVGINAKVFIAARINLEAKRLLKHTDLSVTLIADRLGFEEATNFVKFFKRDACCTPAEFRRQQYAVNDIAACTN